MGILSFVSILFYILTFSVRVSISVDSITQLQSLRDGDTLVSKGGTFELGFFSAGNSEKRYLGIWYKNIPIQTVVWVANRLNPINDSFGLLTVNSSGNLVLTQNNTVMWYTNSQKQAQNPVAQLLDSGNLVVRDENEASPEAYLWQSFDYPSDRLLPGMKLGYDRRIGLDRNLTAWKSPLDPSPGDFSWGLAMNNYPELYMKKGTDKYFRCGPWNGLRFSGTPELNPNSIFDYEFFSNDDEVYFTWGLKDDSVISTLVLNGTDYSRARYLWDGSDKNWRLYSSLPQDACDSYGICGAYGNCITTEIPNCQCLKGFTPKSPKKWNSMDWSQGCVRNKALSCEDKHSDGFMKLVGVKVPDTTHTWVDVTIGLEECRERCLNNCSCMAYTNSDIRGKGSGCVMWFGDLIDIRHFAVNGQDLYIRLPASELGAENRRKNKLVVIVATTVVSSLGMLLLGCYFIYKARRRRKMTEKPKSSDGAHVHHLDDGAHVDDLDLPLLDLSVISMATDNFSMENKIGEGGFGPVYKGLLVNGQEIAVKRLSTLSGQGMTEFKNEVKLIAKLQHRNLVKLIGCCIEGQEKMLVYEYMPNNSLDSFIFDHTQSKLLDWFMRFQIICGIARGVMYLHQDSRLRIIHRDLKASNVLLDDKLNPKVSDFGIAKSCGEDRTEGNTKRIIGSHGYMAPEYVLHGLFSVKSDVFSFGILLLEILSGKKSREFYHAGHTLIGHAWMLWKEGRGTELIDPNIEHVDAKSIVEILRCIHISLLCVQHYPEDRPSMASVVLMLGSEIELANPKEPGFFPNNVYVDTTSSSSGGEWGSTNEMTITLLAAR